MFGQARMQKPTNHICVIFAMRMSNLVHMRNAGLTEVLVYLQTLLFGFKIIEPYCANLRFMVVFSNF